MKHYHIGVIDPTKAYAKAIGKKTGESDYTMYNCKEGETVLVLYEPHAYPTKIQSMLGVLNSSDYIIWVIDAINQDFAEMALSIWLSGKKGMIILSGISAEELAPILSKSPMWQWERYDSIPANELRLKLLALNLAVKAEPKRALVDSCFAVGGVGTVALVKVESGAFAVHDELEATPSKNLSAIRSIQEQDIDVKSCDPSSRAGFALKNTSPEDIKRGSYLAPKGAVAVFDKGVCEVELSPMVKDSIEPNSEIFFSFGLQFVNGKLELSAPFDAKAGKKQFNFSLIAKSAANVGDQLYLVRMNKKPRIIGVGKFVKLA